MSAVLRGRLALAASVVVLALVVTAGIVAFTRAFPPRPVASSVVETMVGIPDSWPRPHGADVGDLPSSLPTGYSPSTAGWFVGRDRIGVQLHGTSAGAEHARCRERITDVRLVSARELRVTVAQAQDSASVCRAKDYFAEFTSVITVPQGLDVTGDVTISRVHAGRTNVYDRALVSTPTATGRPVSVGPSRAAGPRYFWSADHRWLRIVGVTSHFDCPTSASRFAEVRGDDTVVIDTRTPPVSLYEGQGGSIVWAEDRSAAPAHASSLLRICPTSFSSSTTSIPLPGSIDRSKPLHVVVLTDDGEFEPDVTDTEED